MSKRRLFWASLAALGFLVSGCAGADVDATTQDIESGEGDNSSSSSSVPAATESNDESNAVNVTFRTESDNILCRKFEASVECVIAEYSYDGTGDKPEGCDNDWENFLRVTLQNEPGSFSCVSDAAFYTTTDGGLLLADDFPVLNYGDELELGDFTCVVDIATGVMCTNESDNGFIVSKASYEFF